MTASDQSAPSDTIEIAPPLRRRPVGSLIDDLAAAQETARTLRQHLAEHDAAVSDLCQNFAAVIQGRKRVEGMIAWQEFQIDAIRDELARREAGTGGAPS